ncbi:unnamed protein product [[Candida] boidinii]|uniref:thioredoxin-dependent peroxiredoxin n=1 Tax=Candida boidinii TaxID=5477 RepID=A0A9W6T203_CANBO|nr:unnamed protein product [[Candida] boidinii]GMF61759.1 unnamed protein product [[Candida] boidinii]
MAPTLRRSTRISSKTVTVNPESDLKTKKTPIAKVKKGIKKETIVKKEVTEETKELEIGDLIPEYLNLENQDGKELNLLKLAKDSKILVIFAYPKASTPGCTRQAQGFRDTFEELKSQGAVVVGLSADLPKSQTSFKLKQNLQYDLLCDPKREFIGLLGAKKTPSSGIIRSHWVFVDGELKFKDLKVSPEQSVSKANDEVKQLAK